MFIKSPSLGILRLITLAVRQTASLLLLLQKYKIRSQDCVMQYLQLC